jgi:hypothetical protein
MCTQSEVRSIAGPPVLVSLESGQNVLAPEG